MSRVYEYADEISLSTDRLEALERERVAARQEATAREILLRLRERPGIVLADEVGMGKTFVALAVATSVALRNPGAGPVVVMVPPSLREKWPRDWGVFQEKCLSADSTRARLRATPRAVESGVEFLRLLDDPPDRKYHLVFLTHGALSRGLTDAWVKLALIRRAFRRPTLAPYRRAFPRFAPSFRPGKHADVTRPWCAVGQPLPASGSRPCRRRSSRRCRRGRCRWWTRCRPPETGTDGGDTRRSATRCRG